MPVSSKPQTKKVRLAIPSLEGDSIAEWIEVEVPIALDPDTGEELLTGEALQMIDDAKARHMGLLQSAELKSLRERLGLTQKQIGELLQIGEKSWTRWETGKARPSRSMNVLLRALNDGVLPLDYLRALQKGSAWMAAEIIKLVWNSMLGAAKQEEPTIMNETVMWQSMPSLRSGAGISFTGWNFVSESIGLKCSYLPIPERSYQTLQPIVASRRIAHYTPTEAPPLECWREPRGKTLISG
jgi:putative zinc finger/helix-turn-helix YgiT family protein